MFGPIAARSLFRRARSWSRALPSPATRPQLFQKTSCLQPADQSFRRSVPSLKICCDDAVLRRHYSTTSVDKPFELHNYQEDALKACLDAFEEGSTRIAVSMPTGSRKTVVLVHLIQEMRRVYGAKKTLILVGSTELADQAKSTARKVLGPDEIIDLEQGDSVACQRATIVVATYQSLKDPARLNRFDPSEFGLVVVDEAHHSAAPTYCYILQHFNNGVILPKNAKHPQHAAVHHGNKVPIVGFSATMSRPDKVALALVFEDIVYHRDIVEMLDDGMLSPVNSMTVKLKLSLQDVKITRGDYAPAGLARQLNRPEVNRVVVDTYAKLAADRRSTIVFCVDIEHAQNLTKVFVSSGYDARSLSSKMKAQDRDRVMSDFRAGLFPILINCQILTEGADIPQVDCVILARPTRSRNLLTQMVGRGMRLSPFTGKTDCLVIDSADNIGDSKSMAVLPTLFGTNKIPLGTQSRKLSALALDDGEVIMLDEEWLGPPLDVRYEHNGDLFRTCQEYLLNLADPLRRSNKGSGSIQITSRNAWVCLGDQRFRLELIGRGAIDISSVDQTEDTPSKSTSIKYRQVIPAFLDRPPRYMKVVEVGPARNLQAAFLEADILAQQALGDSFADQLSRSAEWRQAPASDKLLKFMVQMGGEAFHDESGNILEYSLAGKRYPAGGVSQGVAGAFVCAVKGQPKARDVDQKK